MDMSRLAPLRGCGFSTNLGVYLVVNIGLWTIWIVDSVANTWEFPWLIFPTVFWGLFVLGQANDTYWRVRSVKTSSSKKSRT